jgi:RNA polymerase sigma factor (sigma-70 family)
MNDPIQRLTRAPLLTRAEEVQLARRYAAGDLTAKDRMVESNMRLAVGIANRFTGRGLDLDDLVQIGALGLVRAVEKFDADKGFKFSTYATWWIQHEIQRALGKQGQAVRTPSNVSKRRRAAENIMAETAAANARAMSFEELAAAVQKELGEHTSCTVAQLKAALAAGQVVASLDRPSTMPGGDAGRSQYDRIPDPSAEDPSSMLFADVRILDEIAKLEDNERELVLLRFGFNEKQLTKAQAAERLGLDRKDAKRAERSALEKLGSALADLDPALEEEEQRWLS